MKKTIIALMALAGMACAETVIFNVGGSSITTDDTDISIVAGTVNDNTGVASQSVTLNDTTLTLKFENGTGIARTNNTTAADNWSNTLGLPDSINLGISDSNMASLLSTSAQIAAGHTGKGQFPGISKFTLTGLNEGQYELISFMGRASGSTTETALTLSGAENVSVTSYVYTNGAWTLANSATLDYVAANTAAAMVNVYSFEAIKNSNIVLSYNGSVSYQGDTQNQNTDIATYQNVQFLALKTIPEPTTATLSLLALAGLAARRRRASR